jgi:short-subunit dehydrogenase
VEDAFGPITILVNNAGANRLGPFAYTPPKEWWRLLTVNLLGPIICTYAVFNSMRKHNKGVIINVASRAGVVTGNFSSAYSSSKAALIRATANLQQELNMEGKDGVSLFSLHPGGVKTSMNERTKSDGDRLLTDR